MAEDVLAGISTRIELPWLAKYKREIGVVWNGRLLETRSNAREVLEWLIL
jgi:hypothetical protein